MSHTLLEWIYTLSLLECQGACCSKLAKKCFRYCACFEQGIPWHSSNNRVKIHSKNACVMIKTTLMHYTDKYSQHSSIIWPVWINSWIFVYELSACGFGSCYSYLSNIMYFILVPAASSAKRGPATLLKRTPWKWIVFVKWLTHESVISCWAHCWRLPSKTLNEDAHLW